MPRSSAAKLLAIALASIFGLGGWLMWRKERDTLQTSGFANQRLAFLEAENRRLLGVVISQNQAADAIVTATKRREIEQTVERLRGLRFQSTVSYREIPREELPKILQQKLAQQVSDRDFGRASTAYALFGLVPPGLDLKKTYLALLGEQVGAFFDQHEHELFTFRGQPLSNSQNQVVLAHELTHALEDQHFHLKNLPLEIKNNDDRALAASALVEGDATLVMNQFMVGRLDATAVRETLAAALTTDVRQLANAPRFLRENLLFPYLQGQQFCMTLFESGGWEALGQAFAHPPTCSAQILHPERYLAVPRWEPAAVEFPELRVLNEEPIVDNVLGELGLRSVMTVWSKATPETLHADGWNGDRYLVYGNRQAASYVWETNWMDHAQAQNFADLAQRSAGQAPGGRRFVGVMYDAAHRRVLVINAHTAQWQEALRAQFAKAYTPSESSAKTP